MTQTTYFESTDVTFAINNITKKLTFWFLRVTSPELPPNIFKEPTTKKDPLTRKLSCWCIWPFISKHSQPRDLLIANPSLQFPERCTDPNKLGRAYHVMLYLQRHKWPIYDLYLFCQQVNLCWWHYPGVCNFLGISGTGNPISLHSNCTNSKIFGSSVSLNGNIKLHFHVDRTGHKYTPHGMGS